MTALVCALLVHVQVLSLLHPHAATVITAHGKISLRAVGDAVHRGIGPPLPILKIAAPSPREKPLSIQIAGLKSARAFPGGLQITARAGELLFVDEAPLEEYVASVVASEMPGAPAAAQQALAVVARSFALHAEQSPRGGPQVLTGTDNLTTSRAGHSAKAALCDTTHCQLFATALRSAMNAARAAAEATRDLVLLLPSNQVAPALHHAACGGRTASARQIWPDAGDDDELASASVDDRLANGTPACAPNKGEPPLQWSATLDASAIAKALGTSLPLSASIDRSPDDGGLGPGWVRNISIAGQKPLGADELHLRLGRVLGWNRIRSSRIYWGSHAEDADADSQVHALPTRIVLRGSGFGHGVGLCQRGAARRARGGESFRQILSRYFPKLTVGRLPIHPDPG